jgi:mono/diheme cytochrome c family protein
MSRPTHISSVKRWLLAGLAVTGGTVFAGVPPPKSVWAGVYTNDQAAVGEDLYAARCATCHGDDLDGRERAPALAGSAFAQRWEGTSLKKLFERMQEMPPDNPAARLAPKQYADVLAFLLSANEIPAGSEPLAEDKDVLATITYTSRPRAF